MPANRGANYILLGTVGPRKENKQDAAKEAGITAPAVVVPGQGHPVDVVEGIRLSTDGRLPGLSRSLPPMVGSSSGWWPGKLDSRAATGSMDGERHLVRSPPR